MDEVDIIDLTIEQYLRLTQESQTPKKIKDMTIAEYLEYEKTVKKNYINNTKSYLPTYFGKGTPILDPIWEFAHYFDPNQPGVESDCDSEDMEEEVEYMTDDEEVMSKQEESDHRHEMKDGIMKRQFEASTASVSNEVSSIASNEVDRADDNNLNTAPCRLPMELSQGNIGQEEETFNPLEIGIDLFSYESPACLEFEQRTRSYGTPNPHDKIAKPISFSLDRRGLVKRWHVCKPVHVTYDDGNGKDYRMWLTCDPDSTFFFGYNEVFGVNEQGSLRMWICFCDHERRTVKGSYMGFADFLQVHYGQQKIDDTTRERWIGHNNLHESDHEFIFNEWILDSYDVEEKYAREIGDPCSRRFDEYNRTFNNEIEHLSNEYILRIGKKGYVLDDV
ncbi:hypothetical protein Tco_0516770 [Tanacetum coccineum]